MKRSKHSGNDPVSCPVCITAAQIAKYPWDKSYIDSIIREEKVFRAKHNAAIARNDRNEAMRSLGLVKVKGALGGTYWE